MSYKNIPCIRIWTENITFLQLCWQAAMTKILYARWDSTFVRCLYARWVSTHVKWRDTRWDSTKTRWLYIRWVQPTWADFMWGEIKPRHGGGEWRGGRWGFFPDVHSTDWQSRVPPSAVAILKTKYRKTYFEFSKDPFGGSPLMYAYSWYRPLRPLFLTTSTNSLIVMPPKSPLCIDSSSSIS